MTRPLATALRRLARLALALAARLDPPSSPPELPAVAEPEPEPKRWPVPPSRRTNPHPPTEGTPP